MIRVWLPKDIGGGAFTRMLQGELEDLGCTRVLPFFVSDPALHWCWWNKGEMKELEPSDEDVDKLSAAWMQRVEKDNNVLNEASSKHLAKEIEPQGNGIKFFIVIPPPMMGVVPAIEMEHLIRQNLLDMLVSAERVVETSMYLGSGFAWILIKGKVSFEAYPLIDDLVQRVNELGVQGHYIRTYTYLAAGSKKPFTTEQEIIETSPSHITRFSFLSKQEADLTKDFLLEELLSGIEGDHLEVKGSLKLHLDRYINDNRHPTEFDERIATEGVLRAVVGFLNSQGGVIIIGALERKRYEKLLQKNDAALANLPICGDWIVNGVNWEYAHTKTLDGFLLLLADLIKDHVGGDASALVTMQPTLYKGKDVIILKVPKGPNWYYLNKNEFYVRRSGSTIPLDGREREVYQKTGRS